MVTVEVGEQGKIRKGKIRKIKITPDFVPEFQLGLEFPMAL